MFALAEMAAFALAEFERGLEGLTDEEARTRLTKADGSQMNAISWTVGHIAGHWLGRPAHLDRYSFRSTDPTPPALKEALRHLQQARAGIAWIGGASDELLASKPANLGGESFGTAIMRATLHTWFHTGEINAIRQMLGHAEVPFVGQMIGNLEWQPASPAG
jgi:hypothetical protein